MGNVKIQLDLYVYTFYVNCKLFKKISLGFTDAMNCNFYTVHPDQI